MREAGEANVKLAALFWFYKEVAVCENHLKQLKKCNPDLAIFGLFGGAASEAHLFQDKLSAYLDDFYESPIRDPQWKWHHGDLMILDWYQQRGKAFGWDSIVPVQWDMLVFDSLASIFKGIGKDAIYLSGLQKLSSRIERRWWWTSPFYVFDREQRKWRNNYLEFRRYIRDRYGYRDQPWCCPFILQVMPRRFLEKYLDVTNRELGFLEYRVPTYAMIFDIPFFDKDLGVVSFVRRSDCYRKPMNAIPVEIKDSYIHTELSKSDGWRVFHPYYKLWNS